MEQFLCMDKQGVVKHTQLWVKLQNHTKAMITIISKKA